MECPNCHAENRSTAKFCNECGRRINSAADLLDAFTAFKGDIGDTQKDTPSGLTEKIIRQSKKINGELRQVTIMFCDMKAFTPLSEKIGPERTFSLMDKIFGIIIRSVNEYDGVVNELRGDGALAFFGAPVATEDAPGKALHCALAIQKGINQFNKTMITDLGIPTISFRIGINSGPAVFGYVGKEQNAQFTAQGDTVNVAARMETLAKPGTIYVTEETYRITRAMFHFDDLGNIKVKGKKNPLRVYRLLSTKGDAVRPCIAVDRVPYSEMVGRDGELARLEFQVMKAVNGEGSIVNIVGEAGIGKSRLIAELKKRDVTKLITLLEGRATSVGKYLSFHPIVDLLRNWMKISASDSEMTAFAKLGNAVRRVNPEETDDVVAFLATLMGIRLSGRYAKRVNGIEGEALEKLIFKNVRDLLIKTAHLRPLAIVAEDLHWADSSSIDMMEYLFRLVESHRIVFANLFRPGYRESGDRIGTIIREKFPNYHIEIQLQPLNRQMSETLVTNMLKIKGFHYSFIDKIVDRSGGNPFFIEEVIHSFVEEGAVVSQDGTLKVTEKIYNISIPRTINDVLMARIDHLDATTRDLVKIASVIGRSFLCQILSEVADSVDNIDERLSYLKEIQILQIHKRKGEAEYFFKHALAQEAAYSSILPDHKRDLHLKVANSIEKIFAEKLHEFYGMLAFHYSKAEDLEMTERYLLKAGEESTRSSASNEALYYYEEALKIYRTLRGVSANRERLAMFERNIALSLYDRGRLAESITHLQKALDPYWGKMPDSWIRAIPKLTSAVLHLIMALYFPILKFKKTFTERDLDQVELYQKMCKALGVVDPIRFFFHFLCLSKRVSKFDITACKLGFEVFMESSLLFSFSGISFRLSRKILDTAKGKFDETDISLVTAYDFLETLHHYAKGDWQDISPYNDDLVNRNLRVGRAYDASQHLYWHGLLQIYQGCFDKARWMVDRLRGIAQEYDNEFSLMLMFELNINLLLESRNLTEALLESEKAMKLAKKEIFHIYLFDLYSYKAWIQILMQDMSDAEASLHEMYRIRGATSAVPIELISFYRAEMEFLLRKLEGSLQEGDNRAFSRCKKEFKTSHKKMMKVCKKAAQHRTEFCKLTGRFYWLIGNRDKAVTWWGRAIDMGKQLGNRLELSRTYFEIGKSLLESKNKDITLRGMPAEEYLEAARKLFEEMDLQWDLEEWRRVALS